MIILGLELGLGLGLGLDLDLGLGLDSLASLVSPRIRFFRDATLLTMDD